jgi:hypothetical protein
MADMKKELENLIYCPICFNLASEGPIWTCKNGHQATCVILASQSWLIADHVDNQSPHEVFNLSECVI